MASRSAATWYRCAAGCGLAGLRRMWPKRKAVQARTVDVENWRRFMCPRCRPGRCPCATPIGRCKDGRQPHLSYLLLGLSLGFSAGLSPGPLLTLVITRSLARFWAGLRVALSPLITDAPIILLTLLLFNAPPPLFEQVVVVGGLYVIYLGVDTMRERSPRQPRQTGGEFECGRHGLVAGGAGQHPQPPSLVVLDHDWRTHADAAWQSGPGYALAFLLGFYALLLGGKITVAMAVAGGRRFLTDAWYRGCWSAWGHYCACLGCCCCGKSPGFGCE